MNWRRKRQRWSGQGNGGVTVMCPRNMELHQQLVRFWYLGRVGMDQKLVLENSASVGLDFGKIGQLFRSEVLQRDVMTCHNRDLMRFSVTSMYPLRQCILARGFHRQLGKFRFWRVKRVRWSLRCVVVEPGQMCEILRRERGWLLVP